METWVVIPGYDGAYEVSDLGNVRRTKDGRAKKLTKQKAGYLVVGLWTQNIQTVAYIHDLVANAFIGPKPRGLCVNHRDGVKANNVPGNLEYVTLAENTLHAMASGLLDIRGSRGPMAKLTEANVLEIRRRAALGDRTTDMASEFGVGLSIISQIKNRTRWRHI